MSVNLTYYDYKEYYPFLDELKENVSIIQGELSRIMPPTNWSEWPEESLYKFVPKQSWDVFTFLGYGKIFDENVAKCPQTARMLRKLPGLKTAAFSRLGPKTRLKPHQGWADLSNHVLRCHLGLIVPDGCGLWVDGKVKVHKEGEWSVFDDSKLHSAFNRSNRDRVVLLIDLERPEGVMKGSSTTPRTESLNTYLNKIDTATGDESQKDLDDLEEGRPSEMPMEIWAKIPDYVKRATPTGAYPFADWKEFAGLQEIVDQRAGIVEELKSVLKTNTWIEYGYKLFDPPGRTMGENARQTFAPIQQNQKWRLFMLFEHHIQIKENIDLCPFLASLLRKIPGCIACCFSLLEAGAAAEPHQVVDNDKILRFHLPLIIPKSDLCLFWVDGHVKKWDEPFMFADDRWHGAWNLSGEDRFILIIDVLRKYRKSNSEKSCETTE